jgi:hypothetical protein
MNLNTDVIDNIYTYLSYNDTCAMECVSNQTGTPASMIRQAAALKITNFMRRIYAQVRMMVCFMRRCIHDEQWRSRYIYVHQIPRPHVCFRVWPVWMLKSPLRYHLMEIALAHADVEIGLHGWAMDNHAEVLHMHH